MNYSEALEKQVAMIGAIESGRFGQEAERMMPGWGPRLGDQAHKIISDAETYWCASAIADLLAETSSSLPLDARMDTTLLPSREGFMWLQKPPPLICSAVPPIAVAWAYDEHLAPPESDSSFGRDYGPHVWVLWFIRCGPPPGFWPLMAFPWVHGQTAEESISFALDHRLMGEREAKLPGDQEDWPLFERQWFLSMLLFIQQRILGTSQQRAERHARKRLERDGFTHEPLIRVVELRRKQARSEQHGDSEPVEWSHQWIVSGHWRQQWYPSLNAHQPRWVMPYVKGPEDKPLKPPRAKVFAVVR